MIDTETSLEFRIAREQVSAFPRCAPTAANRSPASSGPNSEPARRAVERNTVFSTKLLACFGSSYHRVIRGRPLQYSAQSPSRMFQTRDFFLGVPSAFLRGPLQRISASGAPRGRNFTTPMPMPFESGERRVEAGVSVAAMPDPMGLWARDRGNHFRRLAGVFCQLLFATQSAPFAIARSSVGSAARWNSRHQLGPLPRTHRPKAFC